MAPEDFKPGVRFTPRGSDDVYTVRRIQDSTVYIEGVVAGWCYTDDSYAKECRLVDDVVVDPLDQEHHADAGKPRLSLIPSRALLAMVPPLERGARKYGERTYRQVPNGAVRYFESLLRHVEAMRQGYQDRGVDGLLAMDPDGFSHLSAVLADASILVDLLVDLLTNPPQDGDETEE